MMPVFLDFENREILQDLIITLPVGALFIGYLAWNLSPDLNSFITGQIKRGNPLIGNILIVTALCCITLMKLIEIPYSVWICVGGILSMIAGVW
jgi:hypothetical protein